MFPGRKSHDKHDISNTSYIQQLDSQVTKYNNLIREAQRISLALDGNPSKEEAAFYYQASKICEEIMNSNQTQPAVFSQWKYRKLECEQNVQRIRDALCPKPVPQPQPQTPAEPAQIAQTSANNTQTQSQTAPTKSKTGFQSRNASKDVPIETIEKWHVTEIPDHDFSDVKGREELCELLMNEAASIGWDEVDKELKISPMKSYFFYGPPGTGKSFIIEAFAGELMKKGFSFIQLTGSQIHASLVGVAEKTVQAAFAEAMDHAPCLLYIDEIENVCVGRGKNAEGHERRLTVAFLEAYNKMKSSKKKVIFMGATNHPGMVDIAMVDRVKLIKMPLPTEELREMFFDGSMGSLKLEDDITFAEMAEVSDNYSFRDMEKLVSAMTAEVKAKAIKDPRFCVLDENGERDQEATDKRVKEAIRNGEIRLNREIFEKNKEANPPIDKTEIREELRQFENNVKNMG